MDVILMESSSETRRTEDYLMGFFISFFSLATNDGVDFFVSLVLN